MELILSISAMLVPWFLGFAVVRPFLKQRYGYRALAVGAGFIIGWALVVALLQLYLYIGRPFSVVEFVSIQALIALPLLLFVSAKRCSIDELRLEKALPNSSYFLALLVILALCYRVGLIADSLLLQPPRAWSAWLVTQLAISPEVTLTASIDFNTLSPAVAEADSLTLQQLYVALAWGDWSDSMTHFVCLGASIALIFSVFGGLRYLDAGLLPALLSAYLVVSLPLWDMQASNGGFANIWASLLVLVTALLFVICLSYLEWRLAPLLIALFLVGFITGKMAIIFMAGLVVVLAWRLLGGLVAIAALFLLGVFLYAGDWSQFAQLAKWAPEAESSPLWQTLKQQWLVIDNWHFVLVASAGSYLLLLFCRKNSNMRQFSLLIVASITACLTAIVIMLSVGVMNAEAWITLANRTGLYFMPLLGLIPACVYQLTFRDEESIPTL